MIVSLPKQWPKQTPIVDSKQTKNSQNPTKKSEILDFNFSAINLKSPSRSNNSILEAFSSSPRRYRSNSRVFYWINGRHLSETQSLHLNTNKLVLSVSKDQSSEQFMQKTTLRLQKNTIEQIKTKRSVSFTSGNFFFLFFAILN